MKRTIKCCKIDWNNTGRKVNPVELELELNLKNGHECFSCCCSVWNSRHTDLVAGGQCLDEVFKYESMKPWREIFDLWLRHHLNDCTAGSPRQEAAVESWMKRRVGKRYDYSEACAMLKRKGLYEDEEFLYNGKPYKYGHAWLVRDIPAEDLEKIRKWIKQ